MSLTNTLLDSTTLFPGRRIESCRSLYDRDFIRFQPGFGKAVLLQLLFMAMPKEQKEGIADPVLEESSIFEDVDSKFLNAPSWQLKSKLAHFRKESLPPSMCLLGFVLWCTFFSLESGPRCHKICLSSMVRRCTILW
jgi:hypothetical protein